MLTISDGGLVTAPAATIWQTGTLTINGDYTRQAVGTLGMELGGPLRGDEYDALVVTGTMALSGTHGVTLSNALDPRMGDRFDLLSIDGDYAQNPSSGSRSRSAARRPARSTTCST